MSKYQRVKLVFDSFRSSSRRLLTCSRIVAKDVTTARTNLSLPSIKPHYRGFFSSLIKPVGRRIIKTAQSTTSPLSGGANLPPKAAADRKRWLYVVSFVGSVLVIGPVCYFGKFETIPFSNRTHFVIISPDLEKKMGDFRLGLYKESENELKGKMLPDTHPQTIRVRRILNTLTEALQREIVSDNIKGSTAHLVGRKYEIIVKEDLDESLSLMPPNTIVISSALVDYLEQDEEIAVVFATQIAHGVARHGVERLSNPMLFLTLLRFSLHEVFEYESDDYYFPKSTIFWFKKLKRMEFEADYIGMLLLALAGYDPRIAPDVNTKLCKLDEDEENCFSIHSARKKRVENMAQAHVMEEALSKYREVQTRYKDINKEYLCNDSALVDIDKGKHVQLTDG